MKLLFLDIDGVLNDHVRLPNGLCTIQPDKVVHLNRILAEIPDLQIVVSSAWRYYVHNKLMTLEGFEMMLQTHGIACYQRIHGITDPDPETYIPGDHKPPFDENYWHQRGLRWRQAQCLEYWAEAGWPPSVVLDDLELDLANLVRTDRNAGLTSELADQVIFQLTFDLMDRLKGTEAEHELPMQGLG